MGYLLEPWRTVILSDFAYENCSRFKTCPSSPRGSPTFTITLSSSTSTHGLLSGRGLPPTVALGLQPTYGRLPLQVGILIWSSFRQR